MSFSKRINEKRVYSQALSSMVIYREPIFLVKLQIIDGGGNREDNQIEMYNFLKPRNVFTKFVRYLNNSSDDSNLIARRILLDKEIKMSSLKDFKIDITSLNLYPDNNLKYIIHELNNKNTKYQILSHPFIEIEPTALSKYCKLTFKNSPNIIVIKQYHDSEFITYWRDFINMMNQSTYNYHSDDDIITAMKSAKYKKNKTLTDLFTPVDEDEYYLVFERL